jgi:hypothetical protein
MVGGGKRAGETPVTDQPTYVDGAGTRRCVACQSALRDATDEAVIPVSMRALQDLAVLVAWHAKYTDGAWDPMVTYLSEVLGQNSEQLLEVHKRG